MYGSTGSPFGLHRDHVEAMTADGAPLASVEQMLDHAQLPTDQRDALWLFAWSLGQRLSERDGTTEAPHPRVLTPVQGGE